MPATIFSVWEMSLHLRSCFKTAKPALQVQGCVVRNCKAQLKANSDRREHATSTECVGQMLGFCESVPDEARHCASLRILEVPVRGCEL